MLRDYRLVCILGSLALTSLGCTDDAPSDTGTETSTETTGDGDGDGDPGDGDGDGDGDSGDGDGDGDPPAECGNAIAEVGEVCDDGNDIETDFCRNDCTNPCALEWVVEEPLVVLGGQIYYGDIAVDSAGNVIISGQYTNDQGGEDGWIAKYDPMGAGPTWEARITGDNNDAQAVALVIGPDDDIYATGGRGAVDGNDIWIARLAADTGAEVWRVEHDGALEASDDFSRDIALAADGVVVSGTVRDLDKDDDAWIRKLDFDGNELWTVTYGGALADNGFSLDDGGPLVVADDGTIYALAEVYIDFETIDIALLSYASDGAGPDWELMPHAGGTGHQFFGDALSLDGAGSLYLAMSNSASPIGTLWIDKLDLATGDTTWSLGNDDIAALGDGEDWSVNDLLALDGRLALTGSWVDQEFDNGSGRREAYLAQLDADGNQLCYGNYARDVGPNGMAPAALGIGIAVSASGQPLVNGHALPGDGWDRWLGQFGNPE